MWTTIEQIFPYAIAYTIPILITSLGGLYSERSGIVNIGLEGLMIIGSFCAALVIFYLQPLIGDSALLLGILAAMLGGILVSLLHAFASINLNANQVISGTAINMVASALTLYFARTITGSGNIQLQRGLPRIDLPVLKDIPILGRLFFTQTYATTWLVLALLLASWILLYKTPFGLRLRSCGEHPQASDAAGIKVRTMRYIGVMASGAFSGLGGACMLLTYSGAYNGSVSGLGFLALAALIFGQWKPFGILAATFFFGFAATVANVSQVIPELGAIPPVVLKIFPYVLTLVALVVFSKRTRAPKASGQIYDPGAR